jgi:hypothetical protein
MKANRIVTAAAVCLILITGGTACAAEYRIGGGVHYWITLDDIDLNEVDESGVAWMVSLQGKMAPLFKLELDLEIFPEGFAGSSETVLAPQVYALLGSQIYAGAGAGLYYTEGEVGEDPFFVLRAGLDLEILPGIHLDINGNYHFTDFSKVEEEVGNIDFDTVTLGALIRIGM